ncbi:MAG TPA: MopE-related protein [Polyangia bacterium]|jgi:hypothetical protein|nr:MopE-related protein [Polyangia bacterium]
MKLDLRSLWLVRVACLSALALAGCGGSTESTSLVVEIGVQGLSAGVDLDDVRVTVDGRRDATFPVAAAPEAGKKTFPFVVGIVPLKSADEKVSVAAIGRWQGAETVRASAHLGFVKGEVRLLRLTLEAACAPPPAACDSGETCHAGVCGSNEVDVATLPKFTTGAAGSGGNGGADAAAGSGPGDASVDLPPKADALAEGAGCLENDVRACSCGAMAGGSQVCSNGQWAPCKISCAQTGIMGACGPGTRACDESKAQWGACSIAPAAADTCLKKSDETCNGVDNEGCDCLMGETRTCDKASLFGKCAAGTETCGANGKWSACSITPSAADTCVANNDDNCNGKVNEGCPCVQGAKRACSDGGLRGKCATGTQTCDDKSTWGACTITPSSADTCVTGNDDNCNGIPNEGCACLMGQSRTCDKASLFGKCATGTETCDGAGKWSACSITPSAADTCVTGNDDNCNGRTTEGCLCVQGQTRPCSDGGAKGACGAGTQTCDGAGKWGACSVTPKAADTCGPTSDETCNGVPHEGCACVNGQSQSCGLGGYLGKCAGGTQTCVGGTWSACSITPSAADTCVAGNDDNCNGKLNEGCACTNGSTRKCTADALFGKCANGDETCNNGVWSACSITPSAADTCEATSDENCNGTPHDGCACVHNQTRKCSADGKKGTCAGGDETCGVNGTWGACSITPKAADACTSVNNDDDCDGTPFEGCECVSGSSESCNSCGNTRSCSGGAWGLCGTAATCTPGTQQTCGECSNVITCSSQSCTFPSCPSCCPIPVNDKWTSIGIGYHTTPWAIVWPPESSGVTAIPYTETASGGALVMPRDTVVNRVSNFQGSYAVSFNVAIEDPFTFHLGLGTLTPDSFPALRRVAGGPTIVGGLKYGRSESFGSFGAWNSQMAGFASVRMTVYVKSTGQLAAAQAGSPAVRSGFVSVAGTMPGLLQLVGSNLPEYDSSTKVLRISDVVGCAGLTDAQVDALYQIKKEY